MIRFELIGVESTTLVRAGVKLANLLYNNSTKQ
jgi:hypothetical protein